MRLYVLLPVWTALIIAAACQTCPAKGSEPELYTYEVVAEYPHDSRAFTQGAAHSDRRSGPAAAC